ncbi:hypothetical protein CYMTET_24573 [Cymbomonas tetramitiformis]|uniref:Uncharacterized protein n=1 Tax=Cymbomonas tetramitiformis TaxID=36881 RepID=A0AAE0FVL5_9CHLO|nr:hypothetical protein CYMTET_24573 [Cymbomonas tetramitiformis]
MSSTKRPARPTSAPRVRATGKTVDIPEPLGWGTDLLKQAAALDVPSRAPKGKPKSKEAAGTNKPAMPKIREDSSGIKGLSAANPAMAAGGLASLGLPRQLPVKKGVAWPEGGSVLDNLDNVQRQVAAEERVSLRPGRDARRLTHSDAPCGS